MSGEPRSGGYEAIGTRAYRVLADSRDQLFGWREGAYLGEDPEAIHQMRVAARRLRACVRCFRAVIARPVAELEPELKWLGISLGEVRDADVQMERMPELADALLEIRGMRHVQVRRDLESVRFENLTQALRYRIDVGDFDDADLASVPVLFAGPDLMAGAFRAVDRAGRILNALSEDREVHAFRKSVKRLRYLFDAFAGLYGKPAKQFVVGLKDLQDRLGQHQDAIVAIEFCGELIGQSDPAILETEKKRAAEIADEVRKALPDEFERLSTTWKRLKKRMTRAHRSAWK